MTDTKNRESRAAVPAGVGLIFGTALGTVLFALTGSPIWIALGTSLGIIFGAAFGLVRPYGTEHDGRDQP